MTFAENSAENKPKETFLQFCTRRTGFGRTPWGEFAFIEIAIGIMAWVGWDTSTPFAYLFAIVLQFLFIYGTWKNYTGQWK